LRILNLVRRLFAATGYGATSNRILADEVGLTTRAIYHYFDSKLDIYLSVYEQAQVKVFEAFSECIAGETTFVGQLTEVLEAAHLLNLEDPTLARFLGTARVDAARDQELREALRAVEFDVRRRFFGDMSDLGVRTGEIDLVDRPMVDADVRVVTAGLTDTVSNDPITHRAAVDGIKVLLEGKLLRPPV
jgi:AcrR family transcriptional regulator